jgi:hypothetical protein
MGHFFEREDDMRKGTEGAKHMRKQAKCLCLSVVIVVCCLLSFAPNLWAGESTITRHHIGSKTYENISDEKARQLVAQLPAPSDDDAYIDPATGAKGWYFNETSDKPITKEKYEADLERGHAEQRARLQTTIDEVESQTPHLGLSPMFGVKLREGANELKASQNKQMAEVKAQGAGLKPMSEIPKSLVSYEKKKQ